MHTKIIVLPLYNMQWLLCCRRWQNKGVVWCGSWSSSLFGNDSAHFNHSGGALYQQVGVQSSQFSWAGVVSYPIAKQSNILHGFLQLPMSWHWCCPTKWQNTTVTTCLPAMVPQDKLKTFVSSIVSFRTQTQMDNSTNVGMAAKQGTRANDENSPMELAILETRMKTTKTQVTESYVWADALMVNFNKYLC